MRTSLLFRLHIAYMSYKTIKSAKNKPVCIALFDNFLHQMFTKASYAAGIAIRTSTIAPYLMMGHPFAISTASS